MIKNALTASRLLLFAFATGEACMACSSTNPSPMNAGPDDGSSSTDGSDQADGSTPVDGSDDAPGSGHTDASGDGGGSAESDGATSADGPGQEAGSCQSLPDLGDAGLTVTACTVGHAYVKCTYPSGASCDCVSDDPTTCAGCGLVDAGATCRNMCASNQYAVSCGGPPGQDYQMAPAACTGVASTPEGSEFSCCPCE